MFYISIFSQLSVRFLSYSVVNEHLPFLPEGLAGSMWARARLSVFALPVSVSSSVPFGFLPFGRFGGLKWARTTDLSVISRVL